MTVNENPGIKNSAKDIWKKVQRGLIYPSPHAVFVMCRLPGKTASREQLATLVTQIQQDIASNPSLNQSHSSATLGVSLPLWQTICQNEQLPLPAGMTLQHPSEENDQTSKVFEQSSNAFKDSEQDLWLHVKSDNQQDCADLYGLLSDHLKAIFGAEVEITAQPGASKTDGSDSKEGKVLGCRFAENLNNPADPLTIAKHSLVGDEDIAHAGASFVLAQRFTINWSQIHAMSEEQIEDLIGRTTDDIIIPNRDTRSHIKSSRVQDEHGNTTPVLRLGLPFGQSEFLNDPLLAHKGSNRGDEKGIYFAGYAKSVGILENIMGNQIGNVPDYMNDRIFNHVKSDLGGFFYIPCISDLGLVPGQSYHNDWQGEQINDWSDFPGVDWSRLDSHYKDKSDNGYMYYNHKNYIYNMMTMSDEKKQEFLPPSNRILSLLENSFSRWDDNWYINRKQEEMGDLKDYITQYYGPEKAEEVMASSVMIRKGWATKMSLKLLTSEDYGFRGQKIRTESGLVPFCGHFEVPEGLIVNGSDTYRIQPEEIIVGALPNLSLGQGRYVMTYLTEDERMKGYLTGNLSEASGVGHVIPDYDRLLSLGIQGLYELVESHLADETDHDKAEFYRSMLLTLEGVQDYSQSYAKLAFKMAESMAAGQELQQRNLQAIGERMQRLSSEKPESFLDAVQLMFTFHCCLHLTGEPTALGRFDQQFIRFYEQDIQRDDFTDDTAQEIIDALFVKLNEKVLPNRLNMEDHQPLGNLAMGGSAGPYSQGSSINQWIQQITVGGTLATDETESKPAYNPLTMLCLRAARRLPLNAPTLSLRVREDIPEELLEEAAKGVLSGGAHPIFLNDELFIEGLRQSGDEVGGNKLGEQSSKWNSTVSLKSARNYACDGCYEPQFPGENWFSLGGVNMLEPLECALNKGRTYISAGMGYLQGKAVSFTSKNSEDIQDYDTLYQLYKEHFSWLYTKLVSSQLSTYGNNTAYCPSPLLSMLTLNCVESGRDIYSGGAKYNIYGPCFTALGNAINSLYAIKKLVFDPDTAITSLPELLDCLKCDWGHKMTEPFVSSLSGEGRIAQKAERFKRLREKALSLPKYGRGNPEVDAIGDQLLKDVTHICVGTYQQPIDTIAEKFRSLSDRFGSEDHPFGIQIQPGVGTFSSHCEQGYGSGASADGRRAGQTLPSDLSPAPSPTDMPVDHQPASFAKSLAGYQGEGTKAMTNGAPTDFNIEENFPKEDLIKVLKQFARGEGSNILTVTCASPDTFTNATKDPEKYDLIRVRTGGWEDFFAAMFPDKQEQHRRRPLSTPDSAES